MDCDLICCRELAALGCGDVDGHKRNNAGGFLETLSEPLSDDAGAPHFLSGESLRDVGGDGPLTGWKLDEGRARLPRTAQLDVLVSGCGPGPDIC